MKAAAAMIAARRWEAGLLLSMAAAFAYLAWRDMGAFPVMFADEQVYSSLARLVPLGETSMTAFLYFFTYKATSMCGAGFLDCARTLNLLFLIGSAPLVYLVARRVTGKPAAAAAALMSVLAPMNLYASFFMPESMYVFAFWLMTWMALERNGMHWARHALAVGALLGVMMLVKVHALFLTPALALYMVYAGWNRHRAGPWLRIGIAGALLAVASALIVKFAVGYLLAGPNSLYLLGSFYETQASENVRSGSTLFTLLPGALLSLKGHLLVLATVFAVPLASVLYLLARPRSWAAAESPRGALLVWTVLMVGAALGMAVFYTSSVAGGSPVEGLRLHSRYYNFTFGLLLVLAAAHVSGALAPSRAVLRWLIAAALSAALVYGVMAVPVNYFLLLGDGPEFVSLGLKNPTALTFVVLGVQVAALAAWAGSERLGGYAFLFVFMPLYVINAGLVNKDFVAHNRVGNMYDRAGQRAYHTIPPAERNSTTIIGTYTGELLRAKFHVDAPDIDIVDLPWDVPIEPYAIPGRKQWLLVIGGHPLPAGVTPVVNEAEYKIVKLTPDNRSLGSVKMSGPVTGSLLASVTGLSGAAQWGRWATAGQIEFKFVKPLPKKLNVFLTAQGLNEQNVGKEIAMRVGGQERRFVLPAMPQEVHLKFTTDGAQDVVTVATPDEKARPLAIGVWKLEIGERNGE